MNVSSTSNNNVDISRTDSPQPVVKAKVVQKQTNNQELKRFPNKESEHEEVKKSVAKLNDFFDPVKTNLKFEFHEDLHEYYVTIVDPLTNEVVREIPPKKILDMVAQMTEFIGVLIDEKA